MRNRACLYVVPFVLLAATAFFAWRLEAVSAQEQPHQEEVVTMANMRFLVPSLVILGWDDFFLNSRNEIGLSPAQIQKLLSFRLAFLVDEARSEERLKESELAFYEEVSRDQVSAAQVEARIQALSALKAKLLTLRFRALLLAINVLSHEQHVKLASYLSLPFPPLPRGRRDTPPIAPPDQFSEMAPYARYAEYSDDKWLRAEVERCALQPSVSVDAFLGYERGREAAESLMKSADHLRKLLSARQQSWDEARKLVGQMPEEFPALESASRVLKPYLLREQFDRLEAQLRTNALAQEVSKTGRELGGDNPNAAILMERAEHLKETTRQWKRSLTRAGEVLCLSGQKPSPPLQTMDFDEWWDSKLGRVRPKSTAPWRAH